MALYNVEYLLPLDGSKLTMQPQGGDFYQSDTGQCQVDKLNHRTATLVFLSYLLCSLISNPWCIPLLELLMNRGVGFFTLGLCEHENVNCVPLISPPVSDHTLTIILCRFHDLISLFTDVLPMHAAIVNTNTPPFLSFISTSKIKLNF